MTTALILYDPTKTAATIAPALQARKSAALESIETITEVTSDQANEAATVIVQQISDLIKHVEKEHDEAKAPYWAACKAISGIRNTFLAELETERTRVNKLCGNFVQDRLEVQREAERERVRQLEKIEQAKHEEEERAEQARIDAEVERRRQVDEAEAQAAKAKSKKAQAEATAKLQELEKQRQEAAAQAERDRAERETQAEQEKAAVAPVAPITKAAGQVVKTPWVFKVTNIFDLVRARPDLVKMEPKTKEINELINELEIRKIPGLEITQEVQIGTRKTGLKFLELTP
jgi:uncharacterized membrane protein YqiK